jgi:hypothetical protein
MATDTRMLHAGDVYTRREMGQGPTGARSEETKILWRVNTPVKGIELRISRERNQVTNHWVTELMLM